MATPARRGTLLHLIGGLILLTMGLSHLGFLKMPDTNHSLQNPVFPFLTNWSVYLVAAVVEIFIGLAVLRQRGQASANTLTLSMVVMLVWYRFAFSYTGGENCNCLGLLGRELHLKKSTARMLPTIILSMLVATTLPWMIANLRRWLAGFFTKKRGLMVLLISILSSRALGELPDDKTIVVNGVATAERYIYNPRKKATITNQSDKVAFSVFLGKSKYSISTTNIENPARWQTMVFDGTNIFTFTPYTPPIFAWTNATDKIFVTISRGDGYIPFIPAEVKIGSIWACFGLDPLATPDDFPLPWAHRSPWAYGWRWDIHTNPKFSSRFAESFVVRRDTNLDLATQTSELLRPQLEYPSDLSEKNDAIDSLHSRKRIANNWKVFEYKCLQWFHSNDYCLPEIATLSKWSDWSSNLLDSKLVISVSEVKILDREIEYLDRPTENCAVTDYRYKASKKKRIFEYASYVVASNQNWRSDTDPELLQQAKEFLAHGREYDDYDQKKNYQLWIIGGCLLCPLIFMLVRQNKQTNKTK